MVGREMALAYPPRAAAAGRGFVCRREPHLRGLFEDVSFAARAGEIVGFGGIQGNGQADVVRALFGLTPCDGCGDARRRAACARARPPRRSAPASSTFPASGTRGAVPSAFHPREHLRAASRAWAGLAYLPARERQATAVAISALRRQTPSAEQRVGHLSGGNQQKVVLGRWTTGRRRCTCSTNRRAASMSRPSSNSIAAARPCRRGRGGHPRFLGPAWN